MNMIIAYDIADARRLVKIGRIMEDYGLRVQKSIFEAEIDERRFHEMKGRIELLIDKEMDGVKYFPLCNRCADRPIAIGICAESPHDDPWTIL